jgi:hypothetical protein
MAQACRSPADDRNPAVQIKEILAHDFPQNPDQKVSLADFSSGREVNPSYMLRETAPDVS